LTAGELLRAPVSRDRQIGTPMLELPEGDELKSLIIEATKSAAGDSAGDASTLPQYLVWNDTRKAGLYRLNWQETPGGSASTIFALNPDARESDLTRISNDDLRERWQGVVPEIIAAVTSSGNNVGVRGEEVWRSLAFCLLGMMSLEACFATWVGRQR
jgi:hypothetical protein